MKEFVKMLPSYYYESNEVVSIQDSIEKQYEILEQCKEDLINQLFVNTATWGLSYWEKRFGIDVDITKSYEYRRSRLKSKMRGMGTVTNSLIKNVANSFDNGTVDVIEGLNNLLTIKFIDRTGTPPNLLDLKFAINEIKPAHLAVLYEFAYLLISNIESMTISELENTTIENFAF